MYYRCSKPGVQRTLTTGHGSDSKTTDTIIPIYEYSCQACGHTFEALVRGAGKPACPQCEGADLERLFSLPTVQSTGTREMAMRAARRRDQRQGEERMRTQREYELNHDDH